MLMRSILLFPALCFLAASAAAGTVSGRVVGVADGDTITVLDATRTQHKVRVAGIDAPERKQPFGQAARQHLARLVFGKDVTVESSKIDRYGRLVGKVFVAGLDAGLEQIVAGMAWHYKAYAREQSPSDREQYANAESRARVERHGLWREDAPVPPWEWRRQAKQ